MKKCITVSPQVRTAELFDSNRVLFICRNPRPDPGILSNFKR